MKRVPMNVYVLCLKPFGSGENWTECHVDFCMFLTPHELNFELLMKTLKRKMKRNA